MSTYRIISAERASFPVSVMCQTLGVSKSGFHAWERRAPSDRALSDAWLTSRIKEIHENARGVYGSRRVQAELRLGEGILVSRKRIRRLMRQAGISGLVKVKRGRTTIRVPGVRVADDLVERKFRPERPTSCGSQTSPTSEPGRGGSISLPFRTPIAGGSSAGRWPSTCAPTRRRRAHDGRPSPPARSGLIHHSDQGAQYVASASASRHATQGSPSRWDPGRRIDNAVAESFFATIKKELVHRHHGRADAI